MAIKLPRSKTKTEQEDREVAGLWSAIAQAKSIGKGTEKISINTILLLHNTIFYLAYPDIAGRFRKNGEDVEPLECVIPPPGRLVTPRVYQFWREFDKRISVIPRRVKRQSTSQRKKWYGQVIDLAAWVQHGLVAIHPFCEGNGRVARLMTNLVLSRFGLPPSRVKFEGEHKATYLRALCQIDKALDYAPLKRLIADSISEAYTKEAQLRRRISEKRR